VLLRSTPDSDERAVSPAPARAAGPLDDAFGVFARPERSASALETRLLGRRFINDFLDKDKPKTSRLLYQEGDTGVVAVVGTAPDTSTPTVCLFDVHGASSGGGCVSVSDLLARRDPYVATGTQQGVGDIVWALVRDDVASVTVKTAGQAAHDVPVTNNLAFVDSPHAICSIRWTNRDGTTGTRTVSDPFGSRPDCR
jgi:hypothetical protein